MPRRGTDPTVQPGGTAKLGAVTDELGPVLRSNRRRVTVGTAPARLEDTDDSAALPPPDLTSLEVPRADLRGPDGPDEVDPLSLFPTEAQVAAAVVVRMRRRRVALIVAAAAGVIVLLLLLVGVAAVTSALVRRASGPSVSTQATLVIQTNSPGWQVTDGSSVLGTTPLTVSLAPGPHRLRLAKGPATRDLDVSLAPGVRSEHFLDLPVAPKALGTLFVDSLPHGAAVAVDGVKRGVTPLGLRDLAVGPHVVTLRSDTRVVDQRVSVAAGASASLVVPLDPTTKAVGWAAIDAPLELQVYEGDTLIGSTRNQRILLLPGRHALRLLNEAVGFESAAVVTIQPGVVARFSVKLPNGSMSINALPWAEVLVDGVRIGETPIANYSVPLGPHELLLRNPRFGEQRRTVVVSLASPVHLGVDLRQ